MLVVVVVVAAEGEDTPNDVADDDDDLPSPVLTDELTPLLLLLFAESAGVDCNTCGALLDNICVVGVHVGCEQDTGDVGGRVVVPVADT